MKSALDSHISEDEMERYVMRQVPEPVSVHLEEHLLICPECQDLLVDTESFVTEMRAALRSSMSPFRRLRHAVREMLHGRDSRKNFQLVWAAGLLGVVLSVLWLPRYQTLGPPHELTLHSFRSAGTFSLNRAPAGKPLVLQIDIRELTSLSVYRVEAIDSRGNDVAEERLTPAGDILSLKIGRGLPAGRYWVRIFNGTTHSKLLREFALQVEKEAAAQ